MANKFIIICILFLFLSCSDKERKLCKSNSGISVTFSIVLKNKYQQEIFALAENKKFDSLNWNFLKLSIDIVESIHTSATELVDVSGGVDRKMSVINGCASIKEYEVVIKDNNLRFKNYINDLTPYLSTKFKKDAFALTTLVDFYVNEENGYFNEGYMDQSVVNTYIEDLFMLEFLILDQLL